MELLSFPEGVDGGDGLLFPRGSCRCRYSRHARWMIFTFDSKGCRLRWYFSKLLSTSMASWWFSSEYFPSLTCSKVFCNLFISSRRILKFLEHLQVKGDCESDAGTRYSSESQSSVWLWGNVRRVWGWKPLSWAHSRHQKASKKGKKKAAHRQLDEKLLAPLQLRNEFSVIWRRIVMEMKRNLDLRVNLLSHAEMSR